MVMQRITCLLVLLLMLGCSLADERAEGSPFPEFYTLTFEKGREFFNELSTKEKFKLYLWDLENWHPHRMYLGAMLAKTGHEVFPYIEEELRHTDKFSAFKVWRLLDVLTELNQVSPITCSNQVIVAAKGAVDRLKKNPYGDEIAVRIKKLVDECKMV